MTKASEKYARVGSGEDIGKRERYSEFFKKYYPLLLFYATRFLDVKQAEDVVQDAFMELWHRRSQIEFGDRLGAFMYRSVYTKAINKIRHDMVVHNYSSVTHDVYMKGLAFMSPDNNEVLNMIESNELGAEINAVIDSLPEKCREVFKLSYLHSLKNKDIADILNISIKTVEAHMYKALKLLRGKLEHLLLFLAVIFIS